MLQRREVSSALRVLSSTEVETPARAGIHRTRRAVGVIVVEILRNKDGPGSWKWRRGDAVLMPLLQVGGSSSQAGSARVYYYSLKCW